MTEGDGVGLGRTFFFFLKIKTLFFHVSRFPKKNKLSWTYFPGDTNNTAEEEMEQQIVHVTFTRFMETHDGRAAHREALKNLQGEWWTLTAGTVVRPKAKRPRNLTFKQVLWVQIYETPQVSSSLLETDPTGQNPSSLFCDGTLQQSIRGGVR